MLEWRVFANEEELMTKMTWHGLVIAVAVLGMSGSAVANDDPDDCTLKTLRGTYVFAATGYNIVSGIAQPKAIVEVIEFHGDGTLSVPAATRSVNGANSARRDRRLYRRGRVRRRHLVRWRSVV